MKDIDLYAQLADIKEVNYRNTLAIATLIEVLIDKGIFTKQEFVSKAISLDKATSTEAGIKQGKVVQHPAQSVH